jgi:hypothetical protein
VDDSSGSDTGFQHDVDLSELKGTCSNTRAIYEKMARDAESGYSKTTIRRKMAILAA